MVNEKLIMSHFIDIFEEFKATDILNSSRGTLFGQLIGIKLTVGYAHENGTSSDIYLKIDEMLKSIYKQ